MRSEITKGIDEADVLRRLIERARLQIDPTSIEKRMPPEPDLVCQHTVEGPVAFELVNLCDPELAKVVAAGSKARSEAFSTADPSARIVSNKLRKTYSTTLTIELLIYADGPIITPDDVIIPTIRPIIESVNGPFRRVWFMGEKSVCVLWQAG